jgi:hypothetical protein
VADLFTDYYCCPICGADGGAVWMGSAVYGACDRHRLRWLIQYGGHQHWDKASDLIATYAEVPADIGQILETARARGEVCPDCWDKAPTLLKAEEVERG